ncbi:hypothetical protein [Amycolatopsis sp. PS_44_ISF1]|uniref:hypothetical protein n=1 Tax=Amycolatopsis sp. PS_44_ISF1 TaxID=2974917 RepID=UPI0028E03AA6|nr:hypothetical protein [Amycolatopsis sp. PS_44_ISF1]MDT8915204.1 hypothetical protein [Amycolatopsis sp. PS_44_ISF1]
MATGPVSPQLRRVVVLIAALVLLGAGPAHAEPGRGVRPVTPAQVSAAVAAAHSPQAVGFVRSNLRRPGQSEVGPITVTDQGVPAYTLSKDFVLERPDAPAGELGYIAVVATVPGGEPTTIKVVPDGPGWHVMAALSGDDERRLSAGLAPGEVLLYEPQINGWYALTGDGVRLLQSSLPQNPVGRFVPLSQYQSQVHARYADKMPGSDYQRRGGIGFTQGQAQPQSAAPGGSGGSGWWWLGGAVLAAVALAGLAVRYRRVRRVRSAG